jgi:AraC family ethanolamine operon transcriptional activator
MGKSLKSTQISTLSLTTFSAEQLRDTVRGSDIEHVQLSGGPFQGHLLRSEFGDSVLDAGMYSQDLLVNGTFPGDRIVLGYILSGSEAGYFNGIRLAANDIIVIGEGGAMEPYRLPAGTTWVAFQTRRDFLESEGIPVPGPSRIMRYSRLSRAALQLGKYLKTIVTLPPRHRSGSTLLMPGDGLVLEDELIAAFRRAIDAAHDSNPHKHRALHRNSARILRQFEEYAAHNLSSELSISDLCAQLGTSQRTLEYLVKDYYAMSPQRYLCVCRLNAARDCLLHSVDGRESVAAIAGRCGFKHLGRFAQYYRKQFDESPSNTLKTAKTPPAQAGGFGSGQKAGSPGCQAD